jgi:hypothetical protein
MVVFFGLGFKADRSLSIAFMGLFQGMAERLEHAVYGNAQPLANCEGRTVVAVECDDLHALCESGCALGEGFALFSEFGDLVAVFFGRHGGVSFQCCGAAVPGG